MKLNNRSFPYPVLVSGSTWRDDYRDSEYQVALEEDIISEGSEFQCDFYHSCSSPEIVDLIRQEKVCYGVMVECSQTMINRMYKSFKEEQSIVIPLKDLYGRFTLTPQIVVLKHVKDFSPEDLHEEFADSVFDLKPGDVLGHDEEITRTCDFQRLTFESLVKVSTAEDLEDYEYEIIIKDYSVNILMGLPLRQAYNQVKENRELVPYIFMSIFKDMYLQVLYELSKHEETGDTVWGRAMLKKLMEHSIELNADTELKELNKYAQKLVSPDGALKFIKAVEL